MGLHPSGLLRDQVKRRTISQNNKKYDKIISFIQFPHVGVRPLESVQLPGTE